MNTEENVPHSFPKSLPKPWLSRGVKLTLKLFFLLFLMLILLIPNAMISDLVREREHRAQDAAQEVMASWGGHQTLMGPILKIPYELQREESFSSGGDKVTTRKVWKKKYLYLLPNDLKVTGILESKTLKRSIYSIPVYGSQIQMSGSFEHPRIETEGEPTRILWPEATLQLGISDLKGIRKNINVTWEAQQHAMEPQFTEERLLSSALETKTPLNSEIENVSPHSSTVSLNKSYAFKVDLEVAGGDAFQVVPLGRQTTLDLSSNWAHPSFFGAFLPEQREITAKGFSAQWSVPEISRNLPRLFEKYEWNEKELSASAFGVRLVDPVDHYSLTDRSIKYAKLFILMSFVAFFLFEILGRLKIHPMQYLLVGLSLVLFYLLLLSLSEHIGFAGAYAVAAAANVAVLTGYLTTILQNKKRVAIMALLWAGLYTYLYTLLKLEDFSLVVGSVGLFVLLSLVMFLTRKINWYQLEMPKQTSEATA